MKIIDIKLDFEKPNYRTVSKKMHLYQVDRMIISQVNLLLLPISHTMGYYICVLDTLVEDTYNMYRIIYLFRQIIVDSKFV